MDIWVCWETSTKSDQPSPVFMEVLERELLYNSASQLLQGFTILCLSLADFETYFIKVGKGDSWKGKETVKVLALWHVLHDDRRKNKTLNYFSRVSFVLLSLLLLLSPILYLNEFCNLPLKHDKGDSTDSVLRTRVSHSKAETVSRDSWLHQPHVSLHPYSATAHSQVSSTELCDNPLINTTQTGMGRQLSLASP